MRPLLVAIVVAPTLLLLAAPRQADACSPLNDVVSPPETERAFDAVESPAAPFVVQARITHYHEDMACADGASCGDLHGLRLDLEVDPATTIIRIDIAGRETFYTGVWDASRGTVQVVVPGFGDDDELDLTIRAIDDRGYLSESVFGNVVNEGHGDDGCSAGGRHSSGVLVLLALMLALVRRRERSPSH